MKSPSMPLRLNAKVELTCPKCWRALGSIDDCQYAQTVCPYVVHMTSRIETVMEKMKSLGSDHFFTLGGGRWRMEYILLQNICP